MEVKFGICAAEASTGGGKIWKCGLYMVFKIIKLGEIAKRIKTVNRRAQRTEPKLDRLEV